MILRLGMSAALHGAAGVAMGIGTTLAVCTLAQVAKKAADHGMAPKGFPGASGMPKMPPSPYTPPKGSADSDNSGPYASGAPDGRL